MAFITFMSDFGTQDHYVAAVKGKIFSKSPNQQIIDITHAIRPYDVSHAAIILKSVFREFPRGTVHLVAVDSVRERSKGIALELEGHLFVGFDCGLLSMISDKKALNKARIDLGDSTFPVKEVLAPSASILASGGNMIDLGGPASEMVELLARQLKVTKREIVGNVVHVDRYGNLISNITKSEFDKMMELNGDGVKYRVRFGREVFDEFHSYFSNVDSGDCFVFFNSLGQLQIGINKGNASQLLGLSIDAPVQIEFYT